MKLYLFSKLPHLFDEVFLSFKNSEAVEIRTFKKDRGIILLKLSNDLFQLKQFGYVDTVLIGDSAKIQKSLKKAIKKEFPRSHKVWLEYYFDVDTDMVLSDKKKPQLSLF
jgi:hypothetical protein